MSVDTKERRGNARYDYPATIEYELDTGSGQENRKGVTINLSRTGVCLYLFKPLGKSEEIVIKTSLPVRSKTARVRWVDKIDDDFYKAGMVFV